VTAASLVAADGPPAPAGERDRIPFWGDGVGGVSVAFDQLRTEDNAFNNVRASFEIDRGSIRLTSGLYSLSDRGLAQVTGSLSFDPAAEFPTASNPRRRSEIRCRAVFRKAGLR